MVPNGWTLNNFNSVAELIHGFQFREHHFSESGVPIVKIASISHLRGVSLEKCSYISEELASEFSKYQIEAGDVLMALTGGTLGKTCKVQEDIELCLQNYRVGNFKPKASFLDKDFLYYFLISFTVQKRIENIVNEAAQPNVGKADFDKIKVLTPPLPEQRKIAKILSTWDKAISTTERLIDNSKQQKKALMQQLLTGKKRLLDDSGKPFEGEWEEITLESLAKYRRGSFPQPYGNPAWVDEVNGYPFIQVYDIDKNMKLKPDTKVKISDAAIGKSVFIPKGTVIVSLQGSIGRVAITQYDAYVDRTVLLFQEFIVPMDKVFFAFIIQELFEIEKTKAPGGTIKTITKEVLSNFKVHIPSITEQQKIASVLINTDQEIELLEQQLTDLKQEKKALMQQLLTGKRRVTIDSASAA